VKPKVFGERRKGVLVRAGRQASAHGRRHAGARTGARARAPADFEGIHGRAGGSGCPLTASETRTNFSGLPKRSMTMPFSPMTLQFVHQFAQAPKDPIIARCVVGSQFAEHFSDFVLCSIRSWVG
jgi:hypothetical protein